MRNTMKWCLTSLAILMASTAAPATAQNDPLEDELENYWTVERDLPVVQDRLHERAGRFGVGLYTGMMSSEPFWWYIPVGGRLTYFFNNHVGVELGGQYTGSESSAGPFTQPTEIHSFFADRLQDGFDPDTDLEDRFLWRANAVLLWNPLYGKWSFLNNKLSHFDFNLAIGGGVVSVLRPDYFRAEASSTIAPEFTFGGGIHFFLSRNLLLRADGRLYVYEGADTPSQRADYDPQDQAAVSDESSFLRRLQVPTEFLLGLTFLF